MSEIRTWLDRLYSKAPGYFTVVVFDKGRPLSTKWFATSETAKAAAAIERYKDKHDIYVSVATHREKAEKGRGSTKTTASITGFVADLDIGTDGHKDAGKPNPSSELEALAILDGLPEPSAVVHTGGGLHVWWLFDQPWSFTDPAEAASASRAWQDLIAERADAKGMHVDSVGDLARLLRVPGTSNLKLATPRPVEARVIDGPAHDLVELAALCAPTAVRAAEPRLDDNSPLGTWAEILEPHGWTQGGLRDDGATLWVRPGKDISEGHSAVTDPYGVPVMVNFSGSVGLPTGPGQRLTKFRVWAHFNFDGDLKAAKAALDRMTKDSPEKLTEVASRFAASRLDWSTFWTEVLPDPVWLCEPLIEAGRQVACYSEAKAGKSLLWLEICAAIANGRAVVGNPAREPASVLYIDQENNRVDIRERLGNFGYSEADDLSLLHYYSFPSLSFLDTDAGGRELYALAAHHQAAVVIIDTLSRVVEGDENENDTYHSFYKYTGVRLKANGISLVRLDHAGKDVSKGMRGASSKTTDVDEVWQLKADENGMVELKRTHSRSNHGESELVLHREDGPLRHTPVMNLNAVPATKAALDPESAELSEVAAWLSEQGMPPSMGINTAYQTVRKAALEDGTRLPYSKRLIEAAQTKRRDEAQ